MRWKLKIHDDTGHARIMLTDLAETIGMATMSWFDYGQIIRRLTQFVFDLSKTTITEILEKRIWHDALNKYENSDFAREKLIEWGWNREVIERYADEIAKTLLQRLVEHLPEHK